MIFPPPMLLRFLIICSLIFGLVAGLVRSSCCLADEVTFLEALEEYGDGDYEEAYELFKRLADEDSDAGAFCNLGVMYHLGLERGVDLGKAEEFYGQAAKQGLAIAVNQYGCLATSFVTGKNDCVCPII